MEQSALGQRVVNSDLTRSNCGSSDSFEVHARTKVECGTAVNSILQRSDSHVTGQQLVMNLVTGGLGTGILSLPWAMAGASLLVGFSTIVSVIILNVFTIMILVWAAEKYQTFDLAGVLGHLPGKLGFSMQIISNIFVWLSMMLCLIGYIIAMVDSAKGFVQGSWLEYRPCLAALCALFVLPLCFLDQRYLSCTSTVALVINLYVFGLMTTVFFHDAIEETLPSGTCSLGFAIGSVTMMSTMMQCVIIQMCVLPMYKELEDRSPQKFQKLLFIAFGILMILFSAFAAVGYATFGPAVQQNVMLDIAAKINNAYGDFAQVGTILVVSACYPIMLMPMVAPIEGIDVRHFSGGARQKKVAINTTICIIVLVSFLVSLGLSELGLINVINGSVSVAVFIALCPGLVGLHHLEQRSSSWRSVMVTLIVFGVLMGIIGLIYVDNRSDQLLSHCIVALH